MTIRLSEKQKKLCKFIDAYTIGNFDLSNCSSYKEFQEYVNTYLPIAQKRKNQEDSEKKNEYLRKKYILENQLTIGRTRNNYLGFRLIEISRS